MARIVTPFGYRLQTDLANEFSRMDSEWFFQWHGLNSGRDVDVDNFAGRRIRIGGVLFEDCESAYWTAIKRYMTNKINDVFYLAEEEIRTLEASKVPAIAEDAANIIEEYCGRIRRHAVDTERAVRGRGYPDLNFTFPYAERMEYSGEIARRKAALAAFYVPEEVPKPSLLPAPPRLPLSKRFERFYDGNKGKWATAALVLTAIGATFAVLRYFL